MARRPSAVDEVDLPRLLLLGSGIYSTIATVLHPLNVVKTRMQAHKGTALASSVRTMVASQGVRGLFAGLGPMLMGAVPARCAYIAALEGVRPSAERIASNMLPETSAVAAASAISGFCAVLTSQIIYVPVDVVTQKMMVAESTASSSAVAIVRQIVARDGAAGVYRGFGLSLLAYLPGGSVWWGSYSASSQLLSPMPHPLVAQACSATAAALCVVALTFPLDTIKTRYQLQAGGGGGEEGATAISSARKLVAREGIRGLYRGAGPRWVHMSLWGGCMIAVYERLKLLCVKPTGTARHKRPAPPRPTLYDYS